MFVLVHGAFHGGWCYREVADILRGRGHRVLTPTLTGMGERRHLRTTSASLSTHIQDILEVLHFEEAEQVVLVGHSYGGMVVTGVADRRPDLIRSLVYLDAFVPADGQALVDLAPVAAWAKHLGGGPPGPDDMLPPFPAEMMGVRPENRERVDRLCTPHAAAAVIEPLRLTGGIARIPRKAYLFADGWNDFGGFSKRLDEFRRWGWHVEETAHGHDMMIDAPQELADFLLRVA